MAYEIVGITGPSGGGKDTGAGHLEELGYLHLSTSDVIKAEALRLYNSIESDIVRQVSHDLRQRLGASALCLTGIEQYRQERDRYKGLVISGMRAVAPAQTVKDHDGLLIFVNAPQDMRFQRMKLRGRPEDPQTMAEFIKFDAEEMSGSLTTGQDLMGVERISDVSIYNDLDLVTFIHRIDEAVGLIRTEV